MNNEGSIVEAGNNIKNHHIVHPYPHPYNNNNHQTDLPPASNVCLKNDTIINGMDDMDTSPSPPMPLSNTSHNQPTSCSSSANTPPLLTQGNLPILSPFVTSNPTHVTTTKSQSGPTNSLSATHHSGVELSLETSSMNPMMMMHMPSMNCSTTTAVSCRVKVEPMESSTASPLFSENSESSSGHSSFTGGQSNSSDLGGNVALLANSASNSCYGTL
jgi:hypothetical protein